MVYEELIKEVRMSNKKYNSTVKQREDIKALVMKPKEEMYFWLSTKHEPPNGPHKMAPRYTGLYRVEQVINKNAVRLCIRGLK
jgi:hypothetical protein